MAVWITILACLLVLAFATRIAIRKLRRPIFRFGHAFPNPNGSAGSDPVQDAVELFRGTHLGPRDPVATSAVWAAERLLGIAPAKRPVYAYVGCLHPALGRIGLVISRAWLDRDPHGVTRCDTGGLVGCIGGFGCLPPAEAATAVVALSHAHPVAWDGHLHAEVDAAYKRWRDYLHGVPPAVRGLDAVRRKCIESVLSGGGQLDRRLWTWEARGFAHVRGPDVEAVVLAPEAYKDFRSSFVLDAPPASLRILAGSPGPSGVHYFLEDEVIDAFAGVLT